MAPSFPTPRLSRRASVAGVGVLFGLVIGGFVLADWWSCVPAGTQATYVGRQSCVQCHQPQAEKWTDSYHDKAMDVATDATVLGDFHDTELMHFGVMSRMFRRDGKFCMNTEGPDGKLADFEIKYVFGVDPLQQYMVEFDRPSNMPPNEIARLQVLRVSWDTVAKKWFYLSPPDVKEKLSPDDDLHWTGIAQCWNTMCADCHSTNLQKNFDVKSQTYHTTFSEIDVSCEACHGPGSIHVELARAKSLFWDRKLGYGLPNLKDKTTHVQIDTCAQCHARRRIVHPNYRPGDNYDDYFATELLGELTYHADGQILDEVYEHGSYLQSKMYHKGVRCSDCHDPHSTKIKHAGNQLCTSCHVQHSAGKYDGPGHHNHKPGSTGSQCVECHMPASKFMDVDPRRDHSLRIPRPSLSVKLGTPNACTGCHRDASRISEDKRKSLAEYADWLQAARHGDAEIQRELVRLDEWAQQKVALWYTAKPDEEPHFAHALHAARKDPATAEGALQRLAKDRRQPAIVRATALAELRSLETPESVSVAWRALTDPEPQVRVAAVTLLEHELPKAVAVLQNPEPSSTAATQARIHIRSLALCLQDPVRLVRTEAARVLARMPPEWLVELLPGDTRREMDDALDEWRRGILANNDRAGAHMALALLDEDRHDFTAAAAAYRTAIAVEPRATGPRTNLAALLDRFVQQADEQAQSAAKAGDARTVERIAADVARYQAEAARLRREELDLLARDARLAPANAAIQLRYGLSLYLNNREPEAESALKKAVALDASQSDGVMALALILEKQKRFAEAAEYADQLVERSPQEPTYQELARRLRELARSQPLSP